MRLSGGDREPAAASHRWKFDFGKRTMSPDTPTHTLFSLMLRDGHISGQGDVVILAGRVSWSSLGGSPEALGS